MAQPDKKSFYQRGDVVREYDDWRFGSAGGHYVNQRELHGVIDLLDGVPRDGVVLDMPVGTGRMAEQLVSAGFVRVFGADFSTPMLSATRERVPGINLSRQDASALAFAGSTFDAAISLRFSFHLPDLRDWFGELARVTKTSGIIVLDTIRWSPRRIVSGADAGLGGRLTTYSDRSVEACATAAGLRVESRLALFVLPSFAYRFVPSPLIPAVHATEEHLPSGVLSKVLWRLRKQ